MDCFVKLLMAGKNWHIILMFTKQRNAKLINNAKISTVLIITAKKIRDKPPKCGLKSFPSAEQ
jgi:hypothetical protein